MAVVTVISSASFVVSDRMVGYKPVTLVERSRCLRASTILCKDLGSMFYSDATATMPTHVVIRPLVKLVGDFIYHSNEHTYKVVALEGGHSSFIHLSSFIKIPLTILVRCLRHLLLTSFFLLSRHGVCSSLWSWSFWLTCYRAYSTPLQSRCSISQGKAVIYHFLHCTKLP